MDRIDVDKDVKIIVIEAVPRVPPALPERLSAATEKLLRGLGVAGHTNAKVAAIELGTGQLADGITVLAELVVWAGGVKAPDFLREIGGLETNRINQLVVRPTLQTSRDENISAVGDCTARAWPEANGGSRG